MTRITTFEPSSAVAAAPAARACRARGRRRSSAWPAPARPRAQSVPINTAPPVISGELKVGSTLTTTNGTWTGTPPPTFTYQWQRCDENGASCAAISGASTTTYVLKKADAGSTLRVGRHGDEHRRQRELDVGADRRRRARPPRPAARPAPASSRSPTSRSPARLLIDQQATTPSLITSSTNQIVAHSRVTACSGRPVQGAPCSRRTVVPYDQFAGQESTTVADGTVNLTLNRQKRRSRSRSKQQLLVMFVKARKNGEDPLAGISNRRLISFPVTLGLTGTGLAGAGVVCAPAPFAARARSRARNPLSRKSRFLEEIPQDFLKALRSSRSYRLRCRGLWLVRAVRDAFSV